MSSLVIDSNKSLFELEQYNSKAVRLPLQISACFFVILFGSKLSGPLSVSGHACGDLGSSFKLIVALKCYDCLHSSLTNKHSVSYFNVVSFSGFHKVFCQRQIFRIFNSAVCVIPSAQLTPILSLGTRGSFDIQCEIK